MAYCKADAFRLSEKKQVKLAKSKKVEERRRLAKRTDIKKRTAQILSKDPDAQVRYNLVRYTTYKEICKELRTDPVKRVRNVAAARYRRALN